MFAQQRKQGALSMRRGRQAEMTTYWFGAMTGAADIHIDFEA